MQRRAGVTRPQFGEVWRPSSRICPCSGSKGMVPLGTTGNCVLETGKTHLVGAPGTV